MDRPTGYRRRKTLLACVMAAAALVDLAGPSVAAASPAEGRQARLEEFAAKASEAIGAGDAEFLRQHFDADALLDRILNGMPLDAEVQREFRRGFKQGLGTNQLLQGALGQSFRFLRIRPFQGRDRLFFRLLLDEGGLNYMVFETAEDEGKIAIRDCYTFATGEWLSDSIRRMVLPALAQADRTLLERIFSPADAAYVRHLEDVKEMSQSFQRGEFAAAVAGFEALPPALQEQKLLNVTYLSALAELEERQEDYKAALRRFEKLFPGDPSLKLMLIDYHILNGDWSAMFDSLDWLEDKVGGDPYADVLRASGMIFKEDWEAAQRFALRAIEREPDLEDGYWTLVTGALNAADHAQVARGLTWLEERFGYVFEAQALGQEPLYTDFLTSPQAREFFAAQN